MTTYTVTLGRASGASITPGVDNATNVILTVSPGNDPYNLSVQDGDTIEWQLDATLSAWTIDKIGIGKKLANKNTVKTQQVFDAESIELPIGPANVYDVQKMKTTSTPVTFGGGKKDSNSRVGFKYRINFTGASDWFIDPEIDVSPARPPEPEDTGGTDTPPTPLGPIKTTTLYAVASNGGKLIRGMGAVDVTKDSTTGQYTVKFNVDVSLGCYTATANSADNPNQGGGVMYALAAPVAGQSDSVVVNLYNQNGDGRYNGFYLAVTMAWGAQSMT